MPTMASRTESLGKASADQSPREAARSTSREFGPASTSIVHRFVSEWICTSSSGRMCCVSQSMSWPSEAAAEPCQMRALPVWPGGSVAIVASDLTMPRWLRR